MADSSGAVAPRVAVVGEGPAADAVRAALPDAGESIDITSPGPADLGGAALGVVAGVSGSDGFSVAGRAAREAGTPWIAVEAGGVGGRPTDGVPASVAGFVPGGGCYRCLGLRVAAAAGAPGPGAGGDGAPEGATDGAESTETAPTTTRPDLRLAGALAGREAVRALGGEPFADVIELPYRRRTFLPVPGCPVCGRGEESGGRDGGGDRYSLVRGWDDVPLDAAVTRAERAVDDRLGPITAVGERESFPAPYYLATVADTEGFSDAGAADRAAGVATDWNRAYVKAVGEGLERYAAGVYRAEEFVTAAPADLDDAVPPDAFVRPDDAPAVDPDEPLSWVPGVDLRTGEGAHLPAEFVHHPPPERRHRPAITTGLGLGTSVDGALRSGAMEVVERDAAMLAWYSTYEPLGLRVEDEAYATLARRARSEGLDATALLLTGGVDVPVAGAVVRRDEWPRFAAGSAAGFDAGAAAADALAEAVQNWMELRALGRDAAEEAGAAVARYADAPREVRDFDDPGTTVAAADVGPADPPARSAALDAAVERAAATDVGLYAARVTTRDLDALGFEAVRVVGPRAQPLFVGDPYFGERARTVPRELGFRPRLDRPHHPFP